MMDIHHDQIFKGFVTQAQPCSTQWTGCIRVYGWMENNWTWQNRSSPGLPASLDMHQGMLIREFVWETAGGKKLKVNFLRFTDMQSTHLGCQRIMVEPLNFSGEVQFRCGLDFNTHYEIGAGWDQTGKGGFQQSGQIINFWKCERQGVIDNAWAIQAQTTRSGIQLFSSFRLHSEQALNTSLVQEEKFIGVDFVLAVQQGVAVSVDKVVVNDWQKTPDVEAVWARGLELTRQYAATTFNNAQAEHAAFWKRVWDVFDIEIDGDPDVLQGLRFSDFQTYQSYHAKMLI